MSANILKEYLISLGYQDNATGKMKKSLANAEKAAKTFAKNFALAGAAVGSVLIAANTGIAKFAVGLLEASKEIKQTARETRQTEAEVYKLNTTLKTMGKTMEEINQDAELTELFNRLQADADKMTPPDMSKGLEQVEALTGEYARLKQSAMYSLQWVGHYLFKHLEGPLEKARVMFSKLNDMIIKNIPKWSKGIAGFLSGFVRIGTTVMRVISSVFTAIKKIFAVIPKELKIVGAAITALGMVIRAGPIGKLIMILTAALLLLEDFYVFLDGGDALLGGVWQKLIDIWKVLKDTGVIDNMKEGFMAALILLSEKITQAKDKVLELYAALKDNGTLEKIGKTILNVGKSISGLIKKLNELGLIEPIIKGLLGTFLGFMAVDGVTNKLNGFAKILEGIVGEKKKLGMLKGLKDAFDGLKKALIGLEKASGILGKLGKAFKGIFSLFSTNPFIVWIIAIGALIGIFTALYKNSEGFRDFVEGIKEKILGIAEKIKEFLPVLLEMLPDILEAGIEILTSLIEGIVSMLPQLIKAFIDIVKKVLQTITKYLPQIIKAGIEILQALIKGIVSILPDLISAAIDLIMAIFNTLIDNLPEIIQAGIEILMALIQGIVEVLPVLIVAAIDLILAIFQAVIDNLDTIIEGGIQVVGALIKGLIQAIPQLVASLPQIVSAIVKGLGKAKDAVFELGKDLISKLWEGIKSMGSWIGDKIGGFVSGLFSKDKIESGVSSSDAAQDDMNGFAEGGIITKEQIARVGEGNKPEAIIPLTKPKRAQEILSSAMKYLGMDTPEGRENFSNKIQGMQQMISNAQGNMNMMAAAAQSVNGGGSTVNNNTYNMQSSFTIHDVSGRPEATANAVDRTVQMRMRNMKGIL